MSEQDKQEAKERLGRARRQGRHAVKNTAQAVKLGTEHVADEVVDGVEHVADEVRVHAPNVSARGLSLISSDLGIGFFASAVSLYSGAIAFHAFKRAILERGMATR